MPVFSHSLGHFRPYAEWSATGCRAAITVVPAFRRHLSIYQRFDPNSILVGNSVELMEARRVGGTGLPGHRRSQGSPPTRPTALANGLRDGVLAANRVRPVRLGRRRTSDALGFPVRFGP